MNHRQHHNRAATWLVTLSGLVLGSSLGGQYDLPEAGAVDTIFAPQFCVPVLDHGMLDALDTQFEEGQVLNTGHAETFICPLIHNFRRDIKTVSVRMGNVLTALTTSCCVIAFDRLGEDFLAECEEVNEAEALQAVQIAGPDADDDGFYVLTCEVQKGESIRSIRVSD